MALEGFEVLESPQALANEIFFKDPKATKNTAVINRYVGVLCVFSATKRFFFFFPSFGQCRLSDLFESFIENTFLFDDDDDVVVYEDVFFYIVYTHLQNYDIHPTSELVSSRCRVISSMSRTTA